MINLNMDPDFIDWAEQKIDLISTAEKERHGDQSTVYRLVTQKGDYFLKIAGNLSKEKERLEWIKDKLPVPKVIGFTNIKGNDALLISAIDGIDLAKLAKQCSGDKIAEKLAEVLRLFHSVPVKNCPFGVSGPGKVLIHGDACLPNFIFKNEIFSGYIDLGDMRIDSPEIDFAAAIWSLEYNLGPGYGKKFLTEYGITNATEELAERLRLRYEDMQKEWGLK